MKISTKRALAAAVVIAVACVGMAVHAGVGTPSGWGVGVVAALCPLGAVEVFLASKTVVPPLLIGLGIAVVLVIVFGRAFCAWGCPVPLLRRLFGVRDNSRRSALDVPAEKRGGASDSRNWVLGGVLITTAAFGFPVFCLVCPVGLTFATIILLWRAIGFGDVSVALLVFPAVLVLEVVVLRRWCHQLCPLGALMSLVARLNRTFRPSVDHVSCIHDAQGVACQRCAQVCPERINLHDKALSAPMSECTRCGECKEACPSHAISFPLLESKASGHGTEAGGNKAGVAAGANGAGVSEAGVAAGTSETGAEVSTKAGARGTDVKAGAGGDAEPSK